MPKILTAAILATVALGATPASARLCTGAQGQRPTPLCPVPVDASTDTLSSILANR
jgi:hypothetical protein